ncbi:MAG: GAF domain-containing protein [Gammaproteobacteria bacterium]
MLFSSIPQNEEARLAALHSLNILDTQPDLRFDCITRFVAQKFEVPICFIGLIDIKRQWFKSAYGIDVKEVSRDISICAHAICEITHNDPGGRVYEVCDTFEDSRLFDSPLVVNEPFVRSSLSFVLQSESQMNIGTLCMLDARPRKFNNNEIDMFIELGSMAEDLVNGRNVSSKIAS